MTAHRTEIRAPRPSNDLEIWYASSRVGARTSPNRGCGLSNRACRIGRANAAVFPLPVSARPMRSRPAKAGGMDSCWIGVGLLYPRDSQASHNESMIPCKELELSMANVYRGPYEVFKCLGRNILFVDFHITRLLGGFRCGGTTTPRRSCWRYFLGRLWYISRCNIFSNLPFFYYRRHCGV